MRLVIHPGWSKTGTTAIQNYLAAHGDELRTHGVVYPKSGRLFDNALHGLSLSLRPLPGLNVGKSAKEIIEGIVAEAEGMDVLILSSELFPVLFDYSEMRPIWDMATSIDVVFTIRQQSDLFVSLYKQLITDPAIVEELTVESVLHRHLHWLNFSHGIGEWRKAPEFSGRTRFMVMTYSRRNMVQRFTKLLGLDFLEGLADASNVAANVSMSDFQAAVLNAMLPMRSTLNLPERMELRKFVAEKVTHEPNGFRLMSDREKNIIDIIYSTSNANVALEFFGAPELFDRLTLTPPVRDENDLAVGEVARNIGAEFLKRKDV